MIAAPDLAPAAAELAAALVAADPARGALPGPGAEAARRARALAQSGGLAVEAARATSYLCCHLFRLGQMAQVQHEAPRVLPQLDAFGLHRERCETLRHLTLAACETGSFDVALDAAQHLVRASAVLADPSVALAAAYALAACFERMGDPWQALRVLQIEIDRQGDRASARSRMIALHGVCAISIGTYLRLRDAAPEPERAQVLARARSAGDAALALSDAVGEVTFDVAAKGNVGEVRVHQGDLAGAERVLLPAARLARDSGLVAHGWRVQTSIGGWLLASGRPEQARAEMEALLHEMGARAPLSTEIRARDCAYRACRALGDPASALAQFEFVERLERKRAVTQLRAQSELFVTRAEAQHAQQQAEQARLDAQAQRERAAEYARRAERDPLTGLGNRRHFERRMAEILPAAAAAERPLSLVMLDIDHFKTINDGHGHAAGDAVLVELAQLLRENTRGDDVVARLGGEEFVIVLPGMTAPLALEVCERLRERISLRRWPSLPPARRVTASLGVAVAPPYDAADLMAGADAALYAAKRSGRDRVGGAD